MLIVKDVVKDLEKLKGKYDELRAEIADDFNDNYIDEAVAKTKILLNLKEAIEQMEGLEVKTQ